jgi:hypothetical protein
LRRVLSQNERKDAVHLLNFERHECAFVVVEEASRSFVNIMKS